jgi:predicted dehydrogenase
MNQRTTRRDFLKLSAAGGWSLGWAAWVRAAEGPAAAASPSAEVRLAVVGLGGLVGGVGGRGRQLIGRLRELPGARIVALCDVDREILDHELKPFKDRGETVRACVDFRRVLDDAAVDAVMLATPNHWHALGTIWACQAGKDVYVEKPFSHDLWEGRQAVAAARKYNRMVQVGTQSRSDGALARAFEYLRRGELGPARYAHARLYRPRDPIGKVSAPTPVPSTVDYDLWCGPAPKTPVMRKQLHYDWHWVWPTGDGEIGNNGVHAIDICRWALGQNQPPRRALSIGGRFAFNDDGETPNTQIALFDYQPAPLICEVRNKRVREGAKDMGQFWNRDKSIVIQCEGGYIAGDFIGAAAFDHDHRKIRDFRESGQAQDAELAHLTNFIAAVRSRNAGSLKAEAMEGHRSTSCCHLANISHRIGNPLPPDEIRESIQANRELSDAFDRCREYLRENGVDLAASQAVLGPWVTFDAQQERFVDEFAPQANALSRRDYRPPFVVPQLA